MPDAATIDRSGNAAANRLEAVIARIARRLARCATRHVAGTTPNTAIVRGCAGVARILDRDGTGIFTVTIAGILFSQHRILNIIKNNRTISKS